MQQQPQVCRSLTLNLIQSVQLGFYYFGIRNLFLFPVLLWSQLMSLWTFQMIDMQHHHLQVTTIPSLMESSPFTNPMWIVMENFPILILYLRTKFAAQLVGVRFFSAGINNGNCISNDGVKIHKCLFITCTSLESRYYIFYCNNYSFLSLQSFLSWYVSAVSR